MTPSQIAQTLGVSPSEVHRQLAAFLLRRPAHKVDAFEIVVAYFRSGDSVVDIANTLNVPASTVHALVKRAQRDGLLPAAPAA